MGQLAKEFSARPHGALPTQPDPNPRHEHAKAISTLRSGRIYDNKVRMPTSSNSPLNSHDDDVLVEDYIDSDDDILHSYETKGEENVPFGHVGDNNVHMHHTFISKEDGNRGEKMYPRKMEWEL